MRDCIFCKIINGDIPSYKIYKDDNNYCFLDINPNSEGHTLVIPKNHSSDFSEMSSDEVSSLMLCVHKLAPEISKAIGKNGFRLISNIGKDSGQEVFHTHFHIIPSKKPVLNKSIEEVHNIIKEKITL